MNTPNSEEYVSVYKFNPEGFHVVADSNTEELNEMGVKPNLVLYYNPEKQEFVITKRAGKEDAEVVLWSCDWFEGGSTYEQARELALQTLERLSESLGG